MAAWGRGPAAPVDLMPLTQQHCIFLLCVDRKSKSCMPALGAENAFETHILSWEEQSSCESLFFLIVQSQDDSC